MRRALALVPMLESSAVTQVPIFDPRIMNIAMRKGIAPEKEIRIPVMAEELWMIEVITSPIKSARRGISGLLASCSKSFAKKGLSEPSSR